MSGTFISECLEGVPAPTPSSRRSAEKNSTPAPPLIKVLDLSLFENNLWTVMYTVSLLTSEDAKSKIKALCGQFDVMFSFNQPIAHPVHHFVGEWSSCAQHKKN